MCRQALTASLTPAVTGRTWKSKHQGSRQAKADHQPAVAPVWAMKATQDAAEALGWLDYRPGSIQNLLLGTCQAQFLQKLEIHNGLFWFPE
jgi:hypothetical protein